MYIPFIFDDPTDHESFGLIMLARVCRSLADGLEAQGKFQIKAADGALVLSNLKAVTAGIRFEIADNGVLWWLCLAGVTTSGRKHEFEFPLVNDQGESTTVIVSGTRVEIIDNRRMGAGEKSQILPTVFEICW